MAPSATSRYASSCPSAPTPTEVDHPCQTVYLHPSFLTLPARLQRHNSAGPVSGCGAWASQRSAAQPEGTTTLSAEPCLLACGSCCVKPMCCLLPCALGAPAMLRCRGRRLLTLAAAIAVIAAATYAETIQMCSTRLASFAVVSRWSADVPQGGQYTVEGTLVSACHPDAVFAVLSDFDSVADVFGSILESRTERDGDNLHLTQARS